MMNHAAVYVKDRKGLQPVFVSVMMGRIEVNDAPTGG
jgi:hypothetical protein